MPHKEPYPTPLQKKRVLVACSASKLQKLIVGLERMGARAIPFPTIELRPLTNVAPMDAALAALEEYAWVIFTSTSGVHYFLGRMRELGLSFARWRNIQVCAIGPATAAALNDAGIQVALVPETYVAEGVLHALDVVHGGLSSLAGRRILIPRAKKARDVLPRALEAKGITVDAVACYENVLPEIDPSSIEALGESPPDLLVFTSSSAVENFLKLLGKVVGRELLMGTTVAALGAVTAGTVGRFGKTVDILAKESTTESLLAGIAEFYTDE